MNNSNLTESIVLLGIVFAVVLGIFLILRALALWYWKIDVVVRNLEMQTMLQRSQRDALEKLCKLQGIESITSTDSKEEVERKAKLFDESLKR